MEQRDVQRLAWIITESGEEQNSRTILEPQKRDRGFAFSLTLLAVNITLPALNSKGAANQLPQALWAMGKAFAIHMIWTGSAYESSRSNLDQTPPMKVNLKRGEADSFRVACRQ